jgi:predicted DNA-binding transcriptional regulator YafY
VAGRKEWTHRRVDIGNVYEQNGTWYLSGQCGLRNDHRQFRLDHIRAVRVLDEENDLADPFGE